MSKRQHDAGVEHEPPVALTQVADDRHGDTRDGREQQDEQADGE